MGGVCSCFHVPDDWTSDNCCCIGCFFRKLKNNHGDDFAEGQNNQQPAGSHNELVLSNGSRPHEPLQVAPEPAGQGDICVGTIALQGGVRLLVYPDQVGPQVQMIKPFAKALSSGADGSADSYEDECPTCLEEYTPENPKIVVKCSHHYHLSCIYEWMERSENCPVCGKLMLFDE